MLVSEIFRDEVIAEAAPLQNIEHYHAQRKALQDIQLDPHTHQDPQLTAELIRRKAELEKEARAKGFVKEENNNPNPIDSVKLDVPLLIRLLEYSREDAKTDMDLHDVADKLIELSTEGRTLTMDDYSSICPTNTD